MDADFLLIYKMKQGSDKAWEQFVRRYYGDILQYCYFHTRSADISEDLTQETFLKFFSALARYQHRGKAKNYLYTIAANLCRDQAGKNRELPLEAAMEAGIDSSAALDDRLLLDAAIRKLPEEFREIILLYYYQNLKLTEIAAVLQIGLPLVKYRLKRGRELLREEIGYVSQ